MRKFLPVFAAVVLVVAGVAVLQLNLAVLEKTERLKKLASAIRDEKETIQVLRAELAHLTSPAELQARAYRYLALMPPNPDHVLIDLRSIPMRAPGSGIDENRSIVLGAPRYEGGKEQ